MGSEEKSKITVDIFGTSYKLLSTSSPEYMKMVAEYVDEQMNLIAKGHPRLDAQRIAVLAAMNMADEYYTMKSQSDGLRQEAERARSLAQAYEQLESRCTALEQQYREAGEQLKRQEDRSAEAERNAAQLRGQVAELERDNAQLRRQLDERDEAADELRQTWEQRLAAAEEENRRLTAELAEYGSKLDRQESGAIHDEYRKLQEEYEKLKTEYNEWIQIMENQ